MRLATPIGLWLGLAAAGVLLAHLVRRRARRQVVPFLPLWAVAAGPRRGGLGAAIVRYLDLALVLLACAAVAVAASGPFLPGDAGTVRDLVLVLDGGVELRAGSRADRLLKVAGAEVRRRARGTRFVLVSVREDGPAVWTGEDRAAALDFLRSHRPAWTRLSAEAAVRLAGEAAPALRDPDLVLCSYRPGRPEGFRLHGVSELAPNAGFFSLEVLGDPESGGRIARAGLRGKGRVEIEGRWAGEVDGRRTVDVPLPATGRVTLRARTAGADRFAPDDALYLLLPEQRTPRVLVVSAGEPSPFLTAALAALEETGAVAGPLDRAPPERAAEAARVYDVLLFDRCVPPGPAPGLRALYLDPPAGGPGFKVGERLDAPALFAAEKEHPILQGFDLERVPPRRARAILGGHTLATAAPGPVVCAAPSWVALGFDPDACILAASPAYPLLLRNCIVYLAGSAPESRPEFHAVGEPAPVAGVAELEGGERLRVRDRLVGPPGFWTLGGETLPVNLLVPDLDLRPPDEPDDPLPGVGRPATPDRPLAAAFGAAAIALLLIAWWVFWRSL